MQGKESSASSLTSVFNSLTEEQLTQYILAFFGLCLSGLPGLLFSGISNVSILTDVTFAALVAAAAYGWIQLVLSARFLHKADKAHFLLVRKAAQKMLYYTFSIFV